MVSKSGGLCAEQELSLNHFKLKWALLGDHWPGWWLRLLWRQCWEALRGAGGGLLCGKCLPLGHRLLFSVALMSSATLAHHHRKESLSPASSKTSTNPKRNPQTADAFIVARKVLPCKRAGDPPLKKTRHGWGASGPAVTTGGARNVMKLV